MTEELKKQVEFFITNMDYKKKDTLEDAVTEAISSAYGTAKRTFKGVQKSDEVIEEFKNSVIHYFNSKSFPQTQEEFNTKHKELCIDWTNILKENGNTGDNLSYGKAQKVVNMMFKYMYCYSYLNNFIKEIPENAFDYCHMTLDSFTLRWISDVWEKDKKAKIIKSDTAWSKLSEKEYDDISKIVKDNEDKLKPYTKFEAEFFIWDYEQLDVLLESLDKTKKKYEEHKDENLKSIALKTDEYIDSIRKISEQLKPFKGR